MLGGHIKDCNNCYWDGVDKETGQPKSVLVKDNFSEFCKTEDTCLQGGKVMPSEIPFYIFHLIELRDIIDGGASVPLNDLSRETWKHLAFIKGFHEKNAMKRLTGQTW